MGCDIHMFAEVKKKWKKEGVPSEWRTVGKVFEDTYHTENESTTYSTYGEGDDFGSYEYNEKYTDEPYNDRNYNLFAILANVRNGYGFAGSDTGDGFNVIAEPKGVPKDASDYYKRQVKEWDGDGHSHSWHTLKDLESFDWGQITLRRGWVDAIQYKAFLDKGKPESWSGGVSGSRVEHVSNEEMDELVKDPKVLENVEKPIEGMPSYYTQVEWKESYRKAVGSEFFEKTIPALKKLLELNDVQDVRIVFFFDN